MFWRNGGNLVRRVNTYRLILELQAIDRKSRKFFTIYGISHSKSDVGRLHIPRKEGGRGLIFIEDCVELTIRGLEVYVHGSEGRLMHTARGDKIDG